jgi:hypothetical protein
MAKSKKPKLGRSSHNPDRNAAALKALHEYQRTMDGVITWSFWERLQVSYYVITKGLPIRAILLYALIQVLSIPRNKHKRPLVLAAIMILLLIPLYFTYQV